MQTVLAGIPPTATSGYKSLHNLNIWGWMCSVTASQHWVGCIISNGVLFCPRAHFQYCVKAQPQRRDSLFFLFSFFSHPACMHHFGVSSPAYHSITTVLTTTDSQNMLSVAFTENLCLLKKNSLLWHLYTLSSLSVVPVFSHRAASVLMCSSKILAGVVCSSFLAQFFYPTTERSSRQHDQELKDGWDKQ